MRVFTFLFFMTFVGVAAVQAAPQTTLREEPSQFEAQNDPYLAAQKATDRRVPQTGSLLLAGGLYSGKLLDDNITTESAGWHLRYTPLDSSWTFHLEQLEQGIWGFGLGRLYDFAGNTQLRASLNIVSHTSGEVGGPFEVKRWRLRVGWVLGDTWTLEPGFGASLIGLDTYILAGYQFRF